MSLKTNLLALLNSIPSNVKLVVVSKTHPSESIRELYDAGQRAFGENKVQEMIKKHDELPQDIEWHFIGHLQTNKIKQIIPFVSLIHSVDSMKLLIEINREATKISHVANCLLQFHIAQEETKFGLDMQEAEAILSSEEFRNIKNISVRGVMGMASFTDDEDQVRKEFHTLKMYFEELKNKFFADTPAFKEISMGMSGDYKTAIEEGSTIVRIGTAVFGERHYNL